MTKKLQKIAQEYFINGDFKKAGEIYTELKMPLEVAYCELYCGNFKTAKNIIRKLPKDSPIEEWFDSFIQIIELNLIDAPSYLQIRNFYEIDLNNLFLAKKKEYIENVINSVGLLVQFNQEIYKLTARVLKNNEQDKLALNFLNRSLDICFNDPETHFLIAEIYKKYNNYQMTKHHLECACNICDYFPAKNMLKNIKI